MRICVIVGQNFPDMTLARHIAQHDRVIIFEPLVEAVAAIRGMYSPRQKVTVVQAACGLEVGKAKFNVYNQNGLSSSLGTVTKESADKYAAFDLSLQGVREVDVVNLHDALKFTYTVDAIKTLRIDAQGMDLTILKTLEPFLERYAIEDIECEADGDGFKNYEGLPDNSVSGFKKFMEAFPRYEFSFVPERNDFNPDLKWVLK